MLERSLNDRGVMRTVITVDETRETISFFGSTAAVDGWRVCIVDTVDELNPNAANALLKILEEPPQRSLFLLVSHSPARALPTILSRCRKLPLRPLAADDVIRAAAQATEFAADDPALVEAAAESEGSVGRALNLLGGDALKLQQRTAALLATLPRVDPRELHALGDSLGISDRVALAAFIDGIDRWISEKLRIEDATIVVARGVILSVGGKDVAIPADAWVIEGKGLTVYPGLFDALTDVGIQSATPPQGEGGPRGGGGGGTPPAKGPEDRPGSSPWRTAANEVSLGDKRIESWRNAGFTTVVSAPKGGFFPGQMRGLRHQLASLDPAELRERTVRRLVPPDALRR